MTDDDRRRDLFDPGLFDNPAPRDIVPGEGLTRDDLVAQNAAAGTWSEVTVPGEVIVDVDGCPVGVEESTTQTVYFAGSVVTRSQLARLGLTPADVPKLTVMDDPRRTSE